MRARLLFVPEDVWVGVYWRKYLHHDPVFGQRWDVWICLLPMLPLHVWWWRK